MLQQRIDASKNLKLWLKQNLWECLLAGFILISFGLILLTLGDYGVSYDEPIFYVYADRMVQVYKNLAVGESVSTLLDFNEHPYYGPAYLIGGRILIAVFQTVFSGLEIYDAWHIVNFLTFLLGAVLVFMLTRRVASKPASLIAACLYLTQPLLWGHGVMNPKDIPFMTAFLAAMVTGLKMVDIFNHPDSERQTGTVSKTRWSGKSSFGFILALFLAGMILADRLFENYLVRLFLQNQLSGLTNAPLNLKILNLVEFGFLTGVGLTGLILFFRKSPARIRWLILAGVVSGLTVANRVLGPAAAGLVLFYAFMQNSKKRWEITFGFVGITLVVAYAAWPFLWDKPIYRFFDSLRVMTAFPWIATMRLAGIDYPASDLPYYFFPKLIAIQFTLPLLLSAAAGTLVFIKWLRTKSQNWGTGVVLLVWFWLPMVAVMAVRPTLYDNFRQLLFIIPPIFAMAGAAVDEFARWVKAPTVRAGLVGIGLLPGIIAGFWLHPYQYVYYNVLVGWTGSVERQYETDYWGTTMCEAAKFVSAQAQPGDTVLFTGPTLSQLFERCATQPFNYILGPSENQAELPDFAVFWSRFDNDIVHYPDLDPVFTIRRGKTVFAVVKVFP